MAVDSYEFSTTPDQLTLSAMKNTAPPGGGAVDPVVEYKPHFHE
jgi:hypothetical protein